MSVKTLLTAEDLWAMPEVPGKRFELVNGELVEMPGTGGVHNQVAFTLAIRLRNHAQAHGLGVVSVDGAAYILRRDPDLVRVPDASFVAQDRVPGGVIPEGYWPLAPDLAIEIVSPFDRPGEVQAKVREYLAAGSKAVWVLWPRSRSVSVHRADAPTLDLGPDDDLDGGDALPGFRVRVGDLFDINA